VVSQGVRKLNNLGNMITLLMWLYKSPTGHRKYEPKHIERLINMFDRPETYAENGIKRVTGITLKIDDE